MLAVVTLALRVEAHSVESVVGVGERDLRADRPVVAGGLVEEAALDDRIGERVEAVPALLGQRPQQVVGQRRGHHVLRRGAGPLAGRLRLVGDVAKQITTDRHRDDRDHRRDEPLPPVPSSGPVATSRAASGPRSRSTRRPSSSRTGTPSETALSYLDPGDSPATRKSVFLETEPVTLPPRSPSASLTSSREKVSSEPVTTTVIPSSVRGARSVASSSMRTPAAFHLSTIRSEEHTSELQSLRHLVCRL